MEFADIVALLLLVCGAAYWWYTQGARQAALKTCRAYCNDRDLLLLDETVALTRLWPRRNEWGRLCWWRLYVFEFTSTGTERYRGRMTQLGMRVETIQLEPYRIPREQAPDGHPDRR